jgi:AbrB family looped-hinge helix DNA binding protein
MARVTSKLQVTIPKAIADRYGIEPGADIEFLPSGDAIRVVPPLALKSAADRGRRLEIFDDATARERKRRRTPAGSSSPGRGWSRADLYGRGAVG